MAGKLDEKFFEDIEKTIRKLPQKLKHKIEIDALGNLENPDWCEANGIKYNNPFKRREHKMSHQESTINYENSDERMAVTLAYQDEFFEIYRQNPK